MLHNALFTISMAVVHISCSVKMDAPNLPSAGYWQPKWRDCNFIWPLFILTTLCHKGVLIQKLQCSATEVSCASNFSCIYIYCEAVAIVILTRAKKEVGSLTLKGVIVHTGRRLGWTDWSEHIPWNLCPRPVFNVNLFFFLVHLDHMHNIM